VTSDGELIAGARRLEACKLLGWKKVPVTVIDLAAIVRGERDENMVRKDLLPSEAVAVAEAIEDVERKAAKGRQGRPGKPRSGKLPEHGSQARDKAAAGTGMGRTSLAKAKEIVTAARAEPERFGKLKDDIDRTDISAAFD